MDKQKTEYLKGKMKKEAKGLELQIPIENRTERKVLSVNGEVKLCCPVATLWVTPQRLAVPHQKTGALSRVQLVEQQNLLCFFLRDGSRTSDVMTI